MLRQATPILVLIASIAMSPVVHAKSVDERNWILVRSDNFDIHSSLSAKRTSDLLVHMEALRSLFVPKGSAPSQPGSKPMKIFVFGRASDYDAFSFPDGSAGVFLSGLDQNLIAVRSGGGSIDSQVILHEYVHYVSRSTNGFQFPKWWQEGFAEYISTSRLKNDYLDVGLPNRSHTEALRRYKPLPWSEVIDSSNLVDLSRKETRMFYAQSWLLTHFLHNRRKQETSIDESWDIYFRAIKSGASPVAAFEQGFDLRIQDLERITGRYKYQFTRADMESLVQDFSVTIKEVSEVEIQVALGQIAVRTGDLAKARTLFESALENEALNGSAIAGLASIQQRSGNYDAAEELFRSAIEMDNDNPHALMAFAKYSIERSSMSDNLFTGGDYLDRAERLLLDARRTGASAIEVDTYLALTYLNQGKDPAVSIDLIEGVIERAPSDQMPLLLLAQICHRMDEKERALELANRVLINEHQQTRTSFAARRLIDDITNGRKRSMHRRPVIAAPTLPNVERRVRHSLHPGYGRRSVVEEAFLSFLGNI